MRKLIVICLTLALLLSLSGCGFTLFREVHEKQTGETLPKGRIEVKILNYLQNTTVTYPDGSSSGTENLYKDAVGENRLVIKQQTGIIYFENGEETRREDYTLDAHGNPITITPSWEDGSVSTFTYAYDEQGRITEKTCFLDGEWNHTISYTYDESGNVLTEDFRGIHTETAEYTYDDQNRVTEVLVDLNGRTDSRTVTEYANNDRKSRVTYYDGEDAITGWEEYTHDGSYETVRIYDGDGTLLYRWEHTYSSEDLLARKIVYSSDDTLISTTLYTYTGIRNEYLVYD